MTPEDLVPPDGRTVLASTPDGRRLGVCEWGDPKGAPLFVLHGSPGSRFLRHPGSGYVDSHLRVITYDRPGYGVSTRMASHSVADVVVDISAIANLLGVDRFGVAGISAGGPRALAAAALLPDRVTRCATVVSSAPFTAEDLDFYAGMDKGAQAGWHAAADGGEALDAACAEAFEWARSGLPGIEFDTDEDEAMMKEAMPEAFRQGMDGYRDDRLALVRDWGFSCGDVGIPTRVMVARDDTSIPTAHWDWLIGHLPDAELVPVPGDHFGPRDVPEMRLMAWVGQSEPEEQR